MVRVLARRGGRMLIRSASAHPYYRYASRARSAYVLGKRAYPYVKRAYGAYKRRRTSNRAKKRKMRARLGERVGQGGAKRDAINIGQGLNTRVFYQQELLNLARGTDTNQRLRDIINFRGIKICMNFNSLTNMRTLFLNVAVVSPRDRQTGGTLPLDEWFRGNEGGAGTRGQPFSDALSAIQFHCLPINTDRYNVHKHIRRKILPEQNTSGTRGNRTIMFYQKLNRQIRYADVDGTDNPIRNMFLVWWIDEDNAEADSAPVLNACDLQLHLVRYFREPKN